MTEQPTPSLPEIESVEPAELLAALRITIGNEFLVAKALIDLIEQEIAPGMPASDRMHVGRLMYSAAHAVEQSARKERAA